MKQSPTYRAALPIWDCFIPRNDVCKQRITVKLLAQQDNQLNSIYNLNHPAKFCSKDKTAKQPSP